MFNYEQYRKAWDRAYTDTPPIPLNQDLELASACNLACTFCAWGESEFGQKMKSEKDFDGKPKKRFMPTWIAASLIEEAADLGIPAIKFNFRGESTLHADFTAIIHKAREEGDFSDLLINTNGNCPEKSIDGLMACTKVMVSLDSMSPETYPKVRVGGNLNVAKNTITELVKRGHKNVWVRRVICADNKGEDFVGAVREVWGEAVKVSEHYAFDRNKDARQSVHDSDVGDWDRQYCGYPSQRIVVTASGRYLPCCMAWRDEFDMGVFPDMNLSQYWASVGRKNLEKELRAGEFKNDLCKKCTSFMAYKRPERDYVKDVEGRAKI